MNAEIAARADRTSPAEARRMEQVIRPFDFCL